MASVAASTGLPLVIMDCRPEGSSYPKGVAAEVTQRLREIMDKGMAAGMKREQFIVDPGIGFGKNVAENYTLIRELACLKILGRPVLLGASRKRLVGAVLNQPPQGRTWGDAAITAAGVAAGAAIIRVHAVEELVQTAKVADAVYGKGEAGIFRPVSCCRKCSLPPVMACIRQKRPRPNPLPYV